ncbi:TPA: alanine racemase, partial [Candidatus Sumerlaeota bacterium]|nr:alanine racemase [Candidatus Sumerlaeota bacterium]
ALARAGIALYGVSPGPAPADLELEPVMSFGCRIAETREVPAGTPISYGRTCVTTRPTRLALLPVAYGNGYPRSVSGKGACALVHGKRAPFLGRVTMNAIVADITDIPEAKAGDNALLFGRDGDAFLPVDEVAQLAGMIPYEVLCNVGRCAPRFFEE